MTHSWLFIIFYVIISIGCVLVFLTVSRTEWGQVRSSLVIWTDPYAAVALINSCFWVNLYLLCSFVFSKYLQSVTRLHSVGKLNWSSNQNHKYVWLVTWQPTTNRVCHLCLESGVTEYQCLTALTSETQMEKAALQYVCFIFCSLQ